MIRDQLKRTFQNLKHNPRVRTRIWGFVRFWETVLFGGSLRERILIRLLRALYSSQFRRDWLFFNREPPHFYNQRWNGFELTYGAARNPYVFLRAFLASEVLRDGDRLLDIGCGDGFFANSFFAAKCKHIDAIDVERSAIGIAKRLNQSPKISFHVLDAVRQTFPSECYDVIVWDGAIGHFSEAQFHIVLEKVAHAIAPSGIFVGSESLGEEGSDHLQYFEDKSALSLVFEPYFKHVLIRTAQYRVGEGLLRKEAYWRCANDLSPRHTDTMWRDSAL